MSGRICYLQRFDRGDQLRAVRLVSAGADELWTVPETDDDPITTVEVAASWLKGRLGGRSLRMLCLDAEGGACSWVNAPSTDPRVIAAAMHSATDEDWASSLWSGVSGVQALAQPMGVKKQGDESARNRLAVLALAENAARIFIDALDKRSVGVGMVTSIWHVLAMAWDPGGVAGRDASAASARDSVRVVASGSPTTGIVLIEPTGRLVWVWSRGGLVLTGGVIRLSTAVHVGASAEIDRLGPQEPIPSVTKQDIGRLTTDWLSWSAQLGEAPQRVICLGPIRDDDEDTLSPAQLGAALTTALPGATVDLVSDADPVGVTLRRLADLPGGALPKPSEPRSSLVELSHRSGRVHRALHRWTALAVLAVAVILGWLGWQEWGVAGQVRAMAADLRAERAKAIARVLPEAIASGAPERSLRNAVASLKMELNARTQRGGGGSMPVLSELETLSLLIGWPGFRTNSISIDQLTVQISGTVEDLETMEDLYDRLPHISGSAVGRWERTLGKAGDRYKCEFVGYWRKDAEGGGP